MSTTAMSAQSPPPASRATLNAARTAASTPTARTNLRRMVIRLEARSRQRTDDDDADGEHWDEMKLDQLRTEWQAVCYARALFYELEAGASGSGSGMGTGDVGGLLEVMERRIKPLWSRKRADEEESMRTAHLPPPIRHLSSMTLLPPVPTPQASQSSTTASTSNLEIQPILDRSTRSGSPMAMTSGPVAVYADDEWGIRRDRDAQYELLPLKTPREELLSGYDGKGAYDSGVGGAAALHEELGSGLADMSHRLKLNALHFANSLEEEKKLLEGSESLLENNLAKTTTSKKTLSGVSRKSRGTTCLTLGACVVVMVAWFWTYLLIRMT